MSAKLTRRIVQDEKSYWEQNRDFWAYQQTQRRAHPKMPPHFRDGMVAHWSMDAVAPTGMRFDSHGANHLQQGNNPDLVPGKLGRATRFFQGETRWMEIGDNAAITMGNIDFTFAGWFRIWQSPPNQAHTLFGKWEGPTLREYRVWYDNATSQFKFSVSNDATAIVTAATPVFVPKAADWYFFEARHDATADQIRVHVEGVGSGTQAHATGVADTATPLFFGLDLETVTDGNIDLHLVSFWKRLLTARERDELYRGGIGLYY